MNTAVECTITYGIKKGIDMRAYTREYSRTDVRAQRLLVGTRTLAN